VLLGDEPRDVEQVSGDEEQRERRETEDERPDQLFEHVPVEDLHNRKLSPR
jgi:hypothetical protein